MSTSDDYKQRVKQAIFNYLSKKDCPICGLKYWNGGVHPHGGTYISDKSQQVWCNGKITFSSGQKQQNTA